MIAYVRNKGLALSFRWSNEAWCMSPSHAIFFQGLLPLASLPGNCGLWPPGAYPPHPSPHPFSPVLTSFDPFDLFWPVFTGFHPFLPIFTRFYSLSPVLTFTQQYPLSPVFTNFHPFSLDFTHFHQVSPIYTHFHLFKSVLNRFHWYQWFCPHMPRDSVAPVCGIFSI